MCLHAHVSFPKNFCSMGTTFFLNVAFFEVLHTVGIARPIVCRKLKKITWQGGNKLLRLLDPKTVEPHNHCMV
jgi:hypothetical protein